MPTRIPTLLQRPNLASGPDVALLKYLPMVRALARRIHARLPRNVDFEDLYSAGLVGLMQASTKFDPAKDVQFGSFAQFRIRGAILDSLRSVDWAPRELRHKGRAVQEAIRALSLRTGDAPSEDQVANELSISLSAYQKLVSDLSNLEIGTLYRSHEGESGEEEVVCIPGPPEDDPLFRCMRGDQVERLTKAIDSLPEQERLVTTLYYYEELTRNEISLLLGLGGSRVSQIRASAVLHLRSALSDVPPQRIRSSAHTPSNRIAKRESTTLHAKAA
jgi:RNA polymerase sigma factor for flagellar operon FliA